MKMKLLIIGILILSMTNCTAEVKPTVLEVTTFKLKTTANPLEFNKLDAKVEANFTSKQPGFIKRQSAVNEEGVYTVLVYWNTMEDAKASMDKFMADTSVGEFASKIEAASMQMNRYTITDEFTANTSLSPCLRASSK